MSLNTQDIVNIRSVIVDALETVVQPQFDHIDAVLTDHGILLEKQGATLLKHSALLEEHSYLLEKQGTLLKQHSAVLSDQSHILSQHSLRFNDLEKQLNRVDGRVIALEADIKELYQMTP